MKRPVAPPGHRRFAFDLDGTLCDTPAGVDYDDHADLVAKCTPRVRALRLVAEALRDGHAVAIVTARGPHVAAATTLQVASWLPLHGSSITVYHRPAVTFDWNRYVEDKATALLDFRADVYVGDRVEDVAAARRARVRFGSPSAWERLGARLRGRFR